MEADQTDQLVGGVRIQQQVHSAWFYTVGYDAFSRVAFYKTPAILDGNPPGPAYVPSSVGDTRFLRQRAVTVQHFQLLRWLKLDGVAQFRHENGTSTGTLADVLPASYALTRPTGFFSANATASKSGFTFTAGLGVEKSNVYHTVLSPRAGASYTFGNTRVRASWGQGFKLPSFYSLGNPLVGNPALVPEFSTGLDAGLEHSFRAKQLHLALTGFSTRYRDLIDFSPSLFKLVNRSTGYGRGVEFEASAKLRGLTLGGSVSYVDAGLGGTAERLRNVPRWSEEVHLSAPLTRATHMSLGAVWVGRRFDYQVPVPNNNVVPGYSTVNVNLAYKLRDDLRSYVRVENLFNRKYHELVGFPSPGSYASAGLTYTMGRHSASP